MIKRTSYISKIIIKSRELYTINLLQHPSKLMRSITIKERGFRVSNGYRSIVFLHVLKLLAASLQNGRGCNITDLSKLSMNRNDSGVDDTI